jgi:hypothetical protein
MVTISAAEPKIKLLFFSQHAVDMRILNFLIGMKSSNSQNNFHRLDRLREGDARAIITCWGVDEYTARYLVNVLAVHCLSFTVGKEVRGTSGILSSTLSEFGRVRFL